MSIDIELACNSIQALLRGLAPQYLNNVPDVHYYLTALNDAVCPYAFTVPGQGSFYQKGAGYKIDDRTFTTFVYVESVYKKDIPSRTKEGILVLQAVRNLFITAANIPLADISTGYQITAQSWEGHPHSDSGLAANLMFGGEPWFGFTLSLNVQTQWIV